MFFDVVASGADDDSYVGLLIGTTFLVPSDTPYTQTRIPTGWDQFNSVWVSGTAQQWEDGMGDPDLAIMSNVFEKIPNPFGSPYFTSFWWGGPIIIGGDDGDFQFMFDLDGVEYEVTITLVSP